MESKKRGLAVVTGASTGIGYELAKCCANHGFDLLIAADEADIAETAAQLRGVGVAVDAVEADLATIDGVDKLYAAAKGRPVEVLLANAGRGLGTIYLVHKVGRDMRARGSGRILITGSIAGFMQGTYQAVYNGTKAFLDSFSFALRHELKDTGVTVTCLMPGATETDFFERADMMDTKAGTARNDDPAEVAATGFQAMMNGDGDVVTDGRTNCRAPSH